MLVQLEIVDLVVTLVYRVSLAILHTVDFQAIQGTVVIVVHQVFQDTLRILDKVVLVVTVGKDYLDFLDTQPILVYQALVDTPHTRE